MATAIKSKTKSKIKNIVKQPVVNTSKKYTNMFAAYRAFWRRGFTEWAGTSSRSEYWLSFLTNALVVFGMLVLFFLLSVLLVLVGVVASDSSAEIASFIFVGIIYAYGLAALVPSISMMTRRWHDAGLSAWWWILEFIAVIPSVAILWWVWTPFLGVFSNIGYVVGLVYFVFSVLPTKVLNNPYHKNNRD